MDDAGRPLTPMDTELLKLLDESGFKLEDFPESLREDSTLIGWVRRYPPEMRAEYLGTIRLFFRIYESLDDEQREEMLELFQSELRDEFERKRRENH